MSRESGEEHHQSLGEGCPEVSTQDYLESTVMCVLTEGLEQVCRVRPANPVDFLALYLLRRSKCGKPVEVPYEEAVPVASAKSVDTEDV